MKLNKKEGLNIRDQPLLGQWQVVCDEKFRQLMNYGDILRDY